MSQDYNNAKIYKITNDFNDDVYVGSTCDTLVKRFSKHKGDSRDSNKQNRPFYKLINEIGFERFRIQLVEDYPCEDKYQLRQREGHFIRQIGTLNKKIAGRPDKEYKKDHYEQNKERILDYHKTYYEQNKERILEYQKKYAVENQEILNEKKKIYYEANKESFSEKSKQNITCECGAVVRIYKLCRHKQTNKHNKLMNLKVSQ